MPSPPIRIFDHDVDLNGHQLVRTALEVVASLPTTDLRLGRVVYLGGVGSERLAVCIGTAGSGTWAHVPRLDLAETVTARWNFTSSGQPFQVSSNTQVANLNASLLQGHSSSEALSALSIPVRDGTGRVHVNDALSPTHAVNLRQLEAATVGQRDRGLVRAATIAALPAHGVSGNVLTASANGVLPAQDGVTLAPGDPFLVKDEAGANRSRHGIYRVTSLGSGGTPWVLTRHEDSDESSEVRVGDTVFVDEGTTQKNTKWTLIESSDTPVVLGTSILIWSKTQGNTLYQAGRGLTLAGDTFHLGNGAAYTHGDLFHASGDSQVARLAAVATGNVLLSNGIANPPVWGKVTLTSHVSGVLPIANGGTASSVALANGRLMVSSGGAIVERAALTPGWIPVGDATTALAPLGGGSANRIIGVNAANTGHEHKALLVTSAGVITAGTWQANNIAVDRGGTGRSSYTTGDMLVASGPAALTVLAAVAVGNVLLSAGTDSVPTWGKVGLATHVSGTLPMGNGGTGQTSWAQGDILYASATNTPARLPIGGVNTVLITGGSLPAWEKLPLATHTSGILPGANGGTGFASYAVGDLLFANGAASLAKLAGVATGNALISGGVGVAPSWGKIGLTSHVSGVLAAANGGTAQGTWVAGDLLYASGTDALARRAIGSNGQVLRVSGGMPVWATLAASDVGAIGGSGTGNRIAKFTGAGTVGNSNFNDSGTLLTALVNLQAAARLGVTGDAQGHIIFTDHTLTESLVSVGTLSWDGTSLSFKTNALFTGAAAIHNLKRVCMKHAVTLTSANATAGLHSALDLTITVIHNLGTSDVTVSVRRTVNDEEASYNWRPVSANAIEIFFSAVPASGALRVVIQG